MKSLTAILASDWRRTLRDPMMLGLSAYIVALAVGARWFVPYVEGVVLERLAFDLSSYIPLIISFFVPVTASMLFGFVGGLLVLETREEDTLRALSVTPTPPVVHLGVLGTQIVVGTVALVFIEALIVGVGVPESWVAVGVTALLMAPTGHCIGFMLSTLASTKTEAFAMGKAINFFGIVPLAAWFVPEPWQYLAGLVPSFWPCKIWWVACEGGDWAWMVAPSVVVSVVWVAALTRLFQRVARGQ